MTVAHSSGKGKRCGQSRPDRIGPLPHCREVERSVAGSLIRNPSLLANGLAHVTESHFTDFCSRTVHQVARDLHAQGKPVDLVTVSQEIAARGLVADVGGYHTIAALLDAAPSTVNADNYGEILDAYRRRRSIIVGLREVERAAIQSENAEDAERQLEEFVAALRTGRPSQWVTIGQLQKQYPHLRPPVIDGLIRDGETANIISTSKARKSFLVVGLALCVATGRPWLGRHAVTQGRVGLVDNELHPETIAHRVKAVADAMEIRHDEYRDRIEILRLRGQLRDIFEIGPDLMAIPPAKFKVLFLDSKYRFAPVGTSENENASEAQFFNEIDRYAARLQAAIVCIHHTSKGSQGEKRVTDVGAGAGAQSRAVDAHIVLREHEEEDVVILEAAVRSFAPVEPLPLRWVFPLWVPAEDVDPTRLRGRLTVQEQRQTERDREGMKEIIDLLAKGPATPSKMRSIASAGRVARLLRMLESEGRVERRRATIRGNETDEYNLAASL